VAGPSGRSSIPVGRWVHGLETLAAVERLTGLGRRLGWWLVRAADDLAVRGGLEQEDLTAGLSKMVRGFDAASARFLLARSQARIARIGKFDVDDAVRLRGFYPDRHLALRLQEAGDPRRAGVQRSIAARTVVAEHVPALAPPLHLHGAHQRGGLQVAYLVEGLVEGRRPANRGETQRLLPTVVELLTRLHEAVGIASRPLSKVSSSGLLARWEGAVERERVPAAIDAAVRRLIERDADLEVSLGHGDLVASNMLIRGGQLTLVDWEHARSLPIAYDLAKPLMQARHPDAALERVRGSLTRTVGRSPSSYRLEEQIALAHVQMLSWSERRRRKAETAGRVEQYEKQTAARIAVLRDLLELGGPDVAEGSRGSTSG
jgi:Ser/Thr protein kinase RdoA (MazF antagonist)